ncbi:hypothetical protein BH11PSE8_BH11PSE8_33700 [soil metagenome]
MNRKLFLTVSSIIALAVGAIALLQPAVLLQSKGIVSNAAANVWMQETGIALVSIGLVAFLLRGQPDSPAMRAFLVGATALQLGLLAIELMAFAEGVITELAGVAPNSVLHLALAFGFAYFAATMKTPGPTGAGR